MSIICQLIHFIHKNLVVSTRVVKFIYGLLYLKYRRLYIYVYYIQSLLHASFFENLPSMHFQLLILIIGEFTVLKLYLQPKAPVTLHTITIPKKSLAY